MDDQQPPPDNDWVGRYFNMEAWESRDPNHANTDRAQIPIAGYGTQHMRHGHHNMLTGSSHLLPYANTALSYPMINACSTPYSQQDFQPGQMNLLNRSREYPQQQAQSQQQQYDGHGYQHHPWQFQQPNQQPQFQDLQQHFQSPQFQHDYYVPQGQQSIHHDQSIVQPPIAFRNDEQMSNHGPFVTTANPLLQAYLDPRSAFESSSMVPTSQPLQHGDLYPLIEDNNSSHARPVFDMAPILPDLGGLDQNFPPASDDDDDDDSSGRDLEGELRLSLTQYSHPPAAAEDVDRTDYVNESVPLAEDIPPYPGTFAHSSNAQAYLSDLAGDNIMIAVPDDDWLLLQEFGMGDYAARFWQALPHLPEPAPQGFEGKLLEYYTCRQAENLRAIEEIMKLKPHLVEARIMSFLDIIIDLHENGVPQKISLADKSWKKGKELPLEHVKASTRIEQLIQIAAANKAIALDIIEDEVGKLAKLARAPLQGDKSRKGNCRLNGNRAEDIQQVRKSKKQNAPDGKRRRGRKLQSQSVDESHNRPDAVSAERATLSSSRANTDLC